ncbi:Dynamin-1 [Labeo rohita]|uniref:Dynamin-1 n=1 Tax=Labeo rohita TaxID=84645 RepID=A0ABQ8LSK8_LABRO|nr:Dynamin-1 [Labeo rohita]
MAPPWPSGSTPPPWSPEPSVPLWPSRSSSSLWLIGSPSRSPSLLAPLWVASTALGWVPPGTACSMSLLAPRSVWSTLAPPWVLPPSSAPWTWSAALLLGVRHPPEPPPKFPPIPTFVVPVVQGRAFREGGSLSPCDLCDLVSPVFDYFHLVQIYSHGELREAGDREMLSRWQTSPAIN